MGDRGPYGGGLQRNLLGVAARGHLAKRIAATVTGSKVQTTHRVQLGIPGTALGAGEGTSSTGSNSHHLMT